MWLSVWTRAVIAPAVRRALAVWCGAGIVGAVIFGPTSMQPHDLTGLALHDPAAGAVIVVTWLLLFVPTARIVVRADAATYLRTLPHREAPVRALVVVALVGLQLPWLILWFVGEGVRGALVIAVVTAIAVALAAWQPRKAKVRVPAWRGALRALCGVYARGLARRGGDAVVRGAGLAVLAGIAAALLVRNNGFAGAHAAVLAAVVIAIVLVPALVGVLLPLTDAHRSAAVVAQSLGISERARIAVLAANVATVWTIAAMLAAAIVVVWTGVVLAVPVALATAIGAALGTTRVLVRARDVARIVVGAIVATAVSVLWLGWLGAPGALLALATGLVAVMGVQ
jgi:hypothetical protein